MRLLVVDDSNIIRARIARAIKLPALQCIREVSQARNGQAAVQVARVLQPDLVTMDLTMPQMDGLACIPEILKIRPDTSILVVSALNDKGTAIEALKLGARGFLEKPFNDEQLCEALLDIMEKA